MNMSNIRITYTGFIAFFVSLITIITGTVFTLILTRSLTQEEYGTWGLISGLIAYVMIINLIVSYWNTREIARKIESGKTAIVGTMILSIGAIMIYVIISIIMSEQTNIDSDVIIFALILIPPMFLNGILSAINLGWKPHVISYGTLAHGIIQVPFALLFVHYFDYGVNGVIFANFIANSISIIILFKYAKPKLKNNLRLFFFKSWLRLSWVPLYPGLFIVIDTLGIVVFSTITGSVLGIAIWAAANVSPGIIKSVVTISRAVYPKLLEGGKKSYLEDNFAHLFYFNFIMTGIVIVFAKPALFALNPIYQEANIVVIILALRNFFFVLTNVFIQNLGGNETIDIKENATFKQYIKSKLFYPHTLRLIQASFFISLLPIGITLMMQNNFEVIELLNFWASLLLVVTIPITIYLYKITKKNLGFSFPIKAVLKYLVSAMITFSLIYVLIENYLVYHEAVFDFVPQVLIYLSFSVVIYFILTYLLDNKTRILTSSIINEIRKKS